MAQTRGYHTPNPQRTFLSYCGRCFRRTLSISRILLLLWGEIPTAREENIRVCLLFHFPTSAHCPVFIARWLVDSAQSLEINVQEGKDVLQKGLSSYFCSDRTTPSTGYQPYRGLLAVTSDVSCEQKEPGCEGISVSHLRRRGEHRDRRSCIYRRHVLC